MHVEKHSTLVIPAYSHASALIIAVEVATNLAG